VISAVGDWVNRQTSTLRRFVQSLLSLTNTIAACFGKQLNHLSQNYGDLRSRNYGVPARVILAVMGGEIFKCFERVCHSVSKEEWRMPLALGTRPNIHSSSIIFEDKLAFHRFTPLCMQDSIERLRGRTRSLRCWNPRHPPLDRKLAICFGVDRSPGPCPRHLVPIAVR
jgi:hypothetical protein